MYSEPSHNYTDDSANANLNSETGHWLVNNQLEIIWSDKAMRSWFGKNDTICGQKCYATIARKNSHCETCPVIKTFRDKEAHACDVKAAINSRGRIQYFKILTAPIFDRNGQIESVLATFADITEKRKKRIRCKIKSIEAKKFTNEISRLSKIFKKSEDRHAAQLKSTTKELKTIFKLGNRLISSLDVREVLNSIVSIVPDILKMSGCVVRILDNNNELLILEASMGVSKEFLDEVKTTQVGEGVSGMVAKTKRPIVIYDLLKDRRLKYQNECVKEDMRSLLAVPILFKDIVLGVIVAFSRRVRRFKTSEINLLSSFAAHAAIALNNAIMHKRVHLNYYNTIMTLVKTIEARDPYTCGHSERVTNYAVKMGTKLNLCKDDIDTLIYAGKLHDIGKIAIPDLILRKKSKLTPNEWAEIESHPVKGVEMIVHLKFLKNCVPLIRHHHERFDGSGYPDRLKDEKIPFLARLLSVADAFDAMTSERPYRRSLTINEAKNEIEQNSKSQFDPELANVLLSVINDYPDIKIIDSDMSNKFHMAS